MSQDEFTRLFKYMSERFDKIDSALESKASNDDMQRVLTLPRFDVKREEIVCKEASLRQQ